MGITITINDLLDNTSTIKKDIVSQYEKMFEVNLPVEVQRIVSHESGNLLYNDKKYTLWSPEEWRDTLVFFGFNFDEFGLVPLLFYDYIVVCYDSKEKCYLFKELGLGSESDDYTSLIDLLNAIIEEDD